MNLWMRRLSFCLRLCAVNAGAVHAAEPARELYAQQCAVCHGPRGDGRGDAAYLLYPRPRDFTRAQFKVRSTPTGSLPRDEDLVRTIRDGMAGTAMPSWKEELRPAEISALVKLLKSFSPRWKEEPAVPALSLGPEPSRTAMTIARGRQVYEKMECDKCHGPRGKGDGPAAPGMTDSDEVPITPYDFTLPGRFKAGAETRDIVRTFLTGMDGTPMPAYHGTMREEEAWSLAHYVQSLASGPRKHARESGNVITAQPSTDPLPLDPRDPAWRRIEPVVLPLRLLWLRGQQIETLQVRALAGRDGLALLVEWNDPMIANKLTRSREFGDAIAVQFALSPPSAHVRAKGKTFFGMGAHNKPVNIWHWKSVWQRDLDRSEEFERMEGNREPVHFAPERPVFLTARAAGNPIAQARRSPVEDLNATGLSTLTTQPLASQNVQGRGHWSEGGWHVVFHRPLAADSPFDVDVQGGGRIPIAFAIWDGDALDRNGQKSVTGWQTLVVPKFSVIPGRAILCGLLAAVATVAFAGVLNSLWRQRTKGTLSTSLPGES